MSPIEEKSMLTQVKIMKDIIQNYDGITYHVEDKGKELFELLKSCTQTGNGEEQITTVPKVTFDKIMDIVYVLRERRKWEKLGSLAENAVPDNVRLKEILKSLT